jgi:hypothetical protein
MMKNRAKYFLIITITIVTFATAWLILSRLVNQDTQGLSIFTDRLDYKSGDIVHITIQNLGGHSIDIYCPAWCALGNFPTTVEIFSNGQWGYFSGFCPSIKPLFVSGDLKGDYIRHTLSAGNFYKLEIDNFKTLQLEKESQLRIVYYLGIFKVPVYSNEFIVKP